MYGNPLLSNSLSFGKIIGGLSKTLSIANQVIPLYQQAKPLISNFSNTMNVLKTFASNTKDTKKEASNIKPTSNNQELNSNHYEITNPPKFFA